MADEHSVSSTSAVRLVAAREINTRLRTRSFAIGTGAILIVLVGFVLLQATLFSGSETSKIALSGQASGVAEPLRATADQLGQQVEISPVTGETNQRAQVESGDLDAAISGNATHLQVLVKSELKEELRPLLNSVTQQQMLNAKLIEAGQDPAQVMSAVNGAQVQVTPLKPPDPETGQRLAIGLIMVVLLYMSVLTYGSMVAQGVVEEKSSRVVEILLSTVRSWQLLFGKVIGLGIVGLAQLVIIAAVGTVVASAAGVLTLSGVAASTVLSGLLWYILGFFLYATIYAGAGALVSRQEDTQSVLTPINLILIIGFVVGFNLLIRDPDSTASTVLSLIPLLSPILMPGRIAAGAAGGWEVAVAALLTVAMIALLTWLGGRMYRNGVLHTGSRMKLSAALRG